MRTAERDPRRLALSSLTAVLLASATAVVPNHANAASWFWGREAGATMVPRPMQHKPRIKAPKAAERTAEKNMPEGPLVIAISIQHQQLKVFDVNGLFAETPISTGMPGHSTPMGVFSVLEKQRWHRSNIYSGAPMPYMQRITWSGVAMHEGVLPGYPASHGCIRMPGAFAVKMFAWTKRGARVVIVPGEISIEDFSHPKLLAHMLEEQKPFAGLAPAKGAAREAALTDNTDDGKPELKLATLADASGSSLPFTKSVAVSEQPDADARRAADTISSDSNTDTSKTAATKDATPAPSGSIASTDAPAQPTEEMAAVQTVEQAIDQAAALVEAAPVTLDTAQLANDTDPAAEMTATAAAKPAGPAAASTAKPELAAAPEAKPDTTSQAPAAASAVNRPSQTASAPATDPGDIPTVLGPKRSGHVAVFISRKDRRLYVRQNFSPVFDVPVTIAEPDKPFGTFVFTARGDKDDATALHWSVVTMPYATKKTVALPPARPGKKARPIVETSLAPPPSTAAEALDRITVPDWALQRVAEAIKPGGSVIVSDHGLGDETGEGTDFIVPLR